MTHARNAYDKGGGGGGGVRVTVLALVVGIPMQAVVQGL